MTGEDVKNLFRLLADTFGAERERLGDLDAAVGDGDHGAGMARGFARASEAAAASPDDDAGEVFTAAGRALMTGVGGASGALFATLFLELGKAAAGRAELQTSHLAVGTRQAVARISRLGKAAPGNKTMLDALEPAAERLEQRSDEPLRSALDAAFEAAQEGAEATRNMEAKHGRARYVPDAGRGHLDPGAVSVALIFETMRRAAKGVS